MKSPRFDVSSWWLNQPIWKICKSQIWIISPNRDEHQEYLKPLAIIFIEGFSTDGELVVWGLVVWDSNRGPPSNNPRNRNHRAPNHQFTTSRGLVMIKKVRAVVDMLCLIHTLLGFWIIFWGNKKKVHELNKLQVTYFVFPHLSGEGC